MIFIICRCAATLWEAAVWGVRWCVKQFVGHFDGCEWRMRWPASVRCRLSILMNRIPFSASILNIYRGIWNFPFTHKCYLVDFHIPSTHHLPCTMHIIGTGILYMYFQSHEIWFCYRDEAVASLHIAQRTSAGTAVTIIIFITINALTQSNSIQICSQLIVK